VERRGGQRVEGPHAIVALVEDQRDVLAGLGQIPVAGGQFLGQRAELAAVGDVAGVDPVQQRDVEIGADQQAETHLPEVAALLLVVAALGQFGGCAGVDVGEEVSAVVDQSTQVELQALDQPPAHLLLEGGDVVGGDQVHRVPEVLRGEPGRVGGQQAGECRLAVPVGELQLAGGGDGAVDGSQQQVLAAGEALVALGGEDGVQQRDQFQALGDVPEGGDIAAGRHFGLQRLGRLAGLFDGGDQVLQRAEVDLADDLGLAVDALAGAGVVVGVAIDELGRETGHI